MSFTNYIKKSFPRVLSVDTEFRYKDKSKTIIDEVPETKLSTEESVMQSIISLFSPDSRYNRIHIKGKTLETISMPSLMNQVIPVELKTLPCIKRGYAVTEKADGIRKLLFIDAKID